MPGFEYPYDLWLVFTAIECAARSTLRLRMPSSIDVETIFVQHIP
jgi:hypothetical protein